MPSMRFTCAGRVTGWGGHTLVITKPNFISFLTHVVTFQVWRPDPTNKSFSLVGSNHLEFTATTLRANMTTIPGRSDAAFFSFEQMIDPSEQIFFLPGDVVGWYIPIVTTTSPLSPLFRDPTPQDCDDAVVDMWYRNSMQHECTYCDFKDGAESVGSTVPLVAVMTGKYSVVNRSSF